MKKEKKRKKGRSYQLIGRLVIHLLVPSDRDCFNASVLINLPTVAPNATSFHSFVISRPANRDCET